MTNLAYLPIFLTSQNTWENTRRTGQVFELLGIFLIFCCVLYLAYVASRYIGKKFSVAGKSNYIKVVDRVSIGIDKQLLLVKVGTGYFLFLLSRKDFRMIAKVDIDIETAEQIEQENETKEQNFNFREIFEKYADKNMKKPQPKKREKNAEEYPDRNETMKDSIERLKKMQEKTLDKEV